MPSSRAARGASGGPGTKRKLPTSPRHGALEKITKGLGTTSSS